MSDVSEAAAVYGWSPTIPDEIDGQLLIPLPDDFEFSEDWWEAIRETGGHVRVELMPHRKLRCVMVSMEGGEVTIGLGTYVFLWARGGGGGGVFDSATAYDLPQGFRKRPDGSWISNERMPREPRPRRETHAVVPDLVWEVRSPRQSPELQQEKMVEWIDGGVRLGWLIDPFERTVWIYRANGEVDALDDPAELSGEDVCSGLVIDMSRVWD